MTLLVIPGFIVFSTYVEVILNSHACITISNSILHVCGGDPIPFCTQSFKSLYSPRMWR